MPEAALSILMIGLKSLGAGQWFRKDALYGSVLTTHQSMVAAEASAQGKLELTLEVPIVKI